MGKRSKYSNWFFHNADFIFDESVLHMGIKTFALSGYEFRREWMQRKSTMGYADNKTGNIRKKGDK